MLSFLPFSFTQMMVQCPEGYYIEVTSPEGIASGQNQCIKDYTVTCDDGELKRDKVQPSSMFVREKFRSSLYCSKDSKIRVLSEGVF